MVDDKHATLHPDEARRIENLLASHGSHRTAGAPQHPDLTAHSAIRIKAYELWLDGGRVDGRDKDDWLRAEAMLSKVEAEPSSHAPLPLMAGYEMATSTMVAGVQTVSELATSALAAVAGLFSPNKAAEPNEPKQVGSGKSAGSDKAESPKAEAGVAPDTDGKDFEKALEVQEKSL